MGTPGIELQAAPAAAEAVQAPENRAGRNNLRQLIHLRWLAVAGQLLTILGVHFGLGIRLPLAEMLALLAALVAFNAACWLRSRLARRVGDGELFAGLLLDVAVLTGLLFYSGGITNPFLFLFLLQVALGAVLLRPGHTWAMVVVTVLCVVALTQWHEPLALPDPDGVLLSSYYIEGLLLCFALDAALLVFFIQRISANLRERDARLADLRQRAAEEEHILRMGLLASGAAHELGTPLATLSVILGDWSRMPPFATDPALREEIDEMQVQLRRCKAIVGGILTQAGETRGEAPVETTLHAFLDELVAHWRRTRPARELRYERDGLPDPDIVSDTALRQMIDNVLDNALEAAPQAPITLTARCEGEPKSGSGSASEGGSGGETLVLRVQDRGPGFAPEMLRQFGKPYQSSKGRPGGGLGLFLSVNVARTLGGSVAARNRPEGGAEVEIRLPLASLVLPEEESGGDRGTP